MNIITNSTGNFPVGGTFILHDAAEKTNSDASVYVPGNATVEALRLALENFNASIFNYTKSYPDTGVEIGVQTAEIVSKAVHFRTHRTEVTDAQLGSLQLSVNDSACFVTDADGLSSDDDRAAALLAALNDISCQYPDVEEIKVSSVGVDAYNVDITYAEYQSKVNTAVSGGAVLPSTFRETHIYSVTLPAGSSLPSLAVNSTNSAGQVTLLGANPTVRIAQTRTRPKY